MAKYFVNPFGVGGDRNTIPEPIQPSGSVSYTTGFGPDYELDQTISPDALDVPRPETNELFYEITSAIQQYQQDGSPVFITTGDNLGTPYPYDYNAIVNYDDGINGVRLFRSLITNNTNLPTVATAWQPINTFISGSVGGTANALTLNTTTTYRSFLVGDTAQLTILANNTGASTLQIGTGAPIPINIVESTGLESLNGDEMLQEGVYKFVYNGTVWVLTNPSISAGTSIVTSWDGSVSPVNVVADNGMSIATGLIGNKILYSKVSKVATQTFPLGATDTTITFDNVVSDTYGWWTGGTSRFIPNVSGLFEFKCYLVIGVLSTTSTRYANINVNLQKNASTIQELGNFDSYYNSGSDTAPYYISYYGYSGVTLVEPGDSFNLSLFTDGDSGMTITSLAATLPLIRSYFEVRYLGKP